VIAVGIVIRLPLVLPMDAAVHAQLFSWKLDANVYTNRSNSLRLV